MSRKRKPSNVIALNGCQIVTGKPVDEIVFALERALAAAKSGQTVALAMCEITKADTVETYSHWSSGKMWQTLGGVALLHHELANACASGVETRELGSDAS